MTRAVVLSSERSGSTLLCDILGQYDACLFHHELFHSNEIQLKGSVISDEVAILRRNKDPVAFMDQVFRRGESEGYKLIGFKLFFYHNDSILRYLVADANYKLILLDRSNTLARYTSLRIAETTGQWGVLKDREVRSSKLEFDRNDFESYEAQCSEMRDEVLRLLSTAGREVFLIEFTSILHQEVLVRLTKFLDVHASNFVTPTIQRQNPVSVLDRFIDPDDVRSYLVARRRLSWASGG